ncbi:type VI secretion system lipoprotein TssJ [Salmonella enterica]|nr:type VI secretion system lipoprotein TssJ [Salmonella enterica]EEJ9029334.1 type VI secretion system lipoprotein TssJ [Salmonella enterica subsp. enterica]
MIRVNFLIFFIYTTLMLCSCSSDSSIYKSKEDAIEHVPASFSPGAITLEIQADPDLNSVRGFSNSCTILLIQSEKIKTLKRIQSNPFLLKEIFNGGGVNDDVLKVDRYTIMPGQQTTLHMDRSENTRYISLVAGYYPFPQKQHMIISTVPTFSKNNGWLRADWSAELSPLSLHVRLGNISIIEFKKSPSNQLSEKE